MKSTLEISDGNININFQSLHKFGSDAIHGETKEIKVVIGCQILFYYWVHPTVKVPSQGLI
jgi:hypothetical protein